MPWSDPFGGPNIAPAQQTYQAIELSEDTALVWPLESSGSPTVATVIDVTPTAAGLALAMPDARQGANGVACLCMTNAGNADFTLTDTFGAQIAVIGTGESWVIVLQDNGMEAGTWEAVQLGATTSNAQAGALAGYGLEAILTELQLSIETVYLNTNTLLDVTYRAKGVVWESGDEGTLQLDEIATLTAGWFALVTNLGTESLEISASAGETINAVASISLPPGGSGSPYSVLIVAASDGFNTFAGTPPVIPISGGGTGATTAEEALENLGGSDIGISIFEAPNAAAILAILGIGPSAFTEYTVAANQVLTPTSINSAFVCTAALTLTLPLSTDVTNQFIFAGYAQGGNVTLSPAGGGESINGRTAGTAMVIPKGASFLLTTDGNGNWWPFFLGQPNGGMPWAVATGTASAMLATFTPTITELSDGLLIAIRAVGANTIAAPTLNVDGLGVRPITKDGGQALVDNDIPGATAELLLRYSAAHTSWELYNPTINLDLISSTQGAILYRNATEWVELAPGADGQVLETHGAAANPVWASHGGRLISVTTYDTAGAFTYTVPDGSSLLIVDVLGGGGGGAGAAVIAAAHVPGGGAGGGGGAYTRGTVSPPTTSYAVVVGAAGAGGVGALSGAAGSGSSFGALFAAGGGAGGLTGNNPTNAEQGGIAVPGAAATVSLPGAVISTGGQLGGAGFFQNRTYSLGGTGGNSPFGAGGTGGNLQSATDGSAAGTAGTGAGSGGGGAAVYSNANAQTANGGAGTAGRVIVYAYT